jgi:hypothetical protein
LVVCVPAVLTAIAVLAAVARPIRRDLLSVFDIARKVLQ